jgi:predicted nucleic acid-binding protein
LTYYEVIWLSSDECQQALELFSQYHLSHNAGLIDVLVGQTDLMLNVPLYTFNRKHYQFILGLQTIQPYTK